MDGLTPEEIAFFETGDASTLGLSAPPAPEPAPALEVAPLVVAPAPVEAPTPAVPGPAATPDLAAQLAAESAARAQLQRAIDALNAKVEAAIPPAPPPPAAPDPATDPLGALMYKVNGIETALAQIQQSSQQTAQMTEQQRGLLDFKNQMNTLKTEFVKTTPDFDEAYGHLRAQRAADLADVGVPQDQIAMALMQDEIAVAQNAVRQGKNPAQVIYGMAKRYGYTPKAAAPAAPTPQEKVAQLAAGQQAAAAPQRGAPVAEQLTLSSLKDASDADLTRVASDDKAWRSIMGGQSDDIFGGR